MSSSGYTTPQPDRPAAVQGTDDNLRARTAVEKAPEYEDAAPGNSSSGGSTGDLGSIRGGKPRGPVKGQVHWGPPTETTTVKTKKQKEQKTKDSAQGKGADETV